MKFNDFEIFEFHILFQNVKIFVRRLHHFTAANNSAKACDYEFDLKGYMG